MTSASTSVSDEATISGFQIPHDEGLGLPVGFLGLQYDNYGNLKRVTDMSYLGDMWEPNHISLTVASASLARGVHSQKL